MTPAPRNRGSRAGRPRRAIAAGAIALALALAVAGCGGSSASMTGLRAAATRACSHAAYLSARIPPPALPAATTDFLRRGVDVLTPELAALHKLRAPNEAAGEYSHAVGALARERTLLRSAVHELDRGADPLRTIKTLQHRLAPVEADDDAAWRTLGVPACVSR